jgi:hypothetical protein
MGMARRTVRALALTILLSAAAQARAQDDLVLRMYAASASGVRGEYEALMADMARGMQGQPPDKIEKTRELLKVLSYNKAALFAGCAAEAEKDRSPAADRVPSAMNLMLRTCVEIKIGQLNKFSQVVAYAEIFFPERISPCGERSRLREQEQMLRPYDFLLLDEAKLYDFARYNECLMTR